MLLDKPLEFMRNHPKLVVAQDFEVACQRFAVERVEYFQGQIKLEELEELWWIQLRVLHRNKPGVATATVLNEDCLNRLIENALISAEQSHPDPWFRFPLWSQEKNSSIGEMKSPPEFFLKSLYPLGDGSPCPLIEKYEWWNVETQLLRRSEREVKRYAQVSAKQNWSCGVLKESFWSEKKDPERLRKFLEAGNLLQVSESASINLPQKLSFSPRAAAPLVEAIAEFLVATKVDSELSPFKREELNKICASKALTLWDNGQDKTPYSFAPFDLDGIASQKTILIDRGQLKGFLYDAQSSCRDNCRSTGNSLREPHHVDTRIKPRKITVSPGDFLPTSFWSPNSRGLWIEGWSKIEMSDRHEAVGGVFGWLIENGKKTKPVKIDQVKISLPAFLKSVTGVGSEITSFGLCECPAVFVEETK